MNFRITKHNILFHPFFSSKCEGIKESHIQDIYEAVITDTFHLNFPMGFSDNIKDRIASGGAPPLFVNMRYFIENIWRPDNEDFDFIRETIATFPDKEHRFSRPNGIVISYDPHFYVIECFSKWCYSFEHSPKSVRARHI